MLAKVLAFVSVMTVQPLVHEDVLELSVVNEIEHAIARAPTNASTTVLLPLATNGLSRTQLAIRLVSTQRADGRWTVGTNDATAMAVKLLKEMVD